jgi:hypothetical protein
MMITPTKTAATTAPVIAFSSIGRFLKVVDGAIPLGRCRRPRAQPRL